MIERASPTQLRKSLEVAHLFAKRGIGFVAVPVANSAEYDALVQQALDKLDAMQGIAGTDPVGAHESKEA